MRSLIRWMMVGLVAAACGGGTKTVGSPFNTKWESDGGESIAAVEKRLRPASVPTGVPLAVGVTANGLVAVGVDGSGQWKHGAKLDARPVIAGDVVVASGSASPAAV